MAFRAGEGLGCPHGGGDTAKSWEEAFDFPKRRPWELLVAASGGRICAGRVNGAWGPVCSLHMSPAPVGARAA